jgi:H+/gluconate symporter-like permease
MAWPSLSASVAEKAFLIGMCAALVGTIPLMYWLLEFVRQESEIKPPQPKTQYINQDTEDSLELSTLGTLLDHYNFAIREMAAKIICDRAINDPVTLPTLFWGITRPDYDERVKNLRALAMIIDNRKQPSLNPAPDRHARPTNLRAC